MKLAKNVSIVVLTHNRSKFIARMCFALDKMAFGGKLIISESSADQNFYQSHSLIKGLNLKIDVKHIHSKKLLGMTISQSMNFSLEEGIKLIQTDYAMLTCDDDIPIPATLDKCVKFLDRHPDYNGVNGELAWYSTNATSKKRNFSPCLGMKKAVQCNPTFGLEQTTASGRLNEYLLKFHHTMFAVVRSPTYRNIFPKNANKITFPHFCADYNWMFGIALTGKIKHLAQPQVVRQYHGENLGIKGPNHPFPSYIDSLVSPNWGNDANAFVENLAALIMNIDKLSHEEARTNALEAFRDLTVRRLRRPQKPTVIEKAFKKIGKVIWVDKYNLPGSNKRKLYHETVTALAQYQHGF